MKIIVDVMGGDNAPLQTVKGAIAAVRELKNIEMILVGDRTEIEKIAAEEGFDLSCVEVVHTESVITMEDDPLCVTRTKKDSSMAVGLKLLAEGKGDAFVSTGNTGALFTGATLIVRKLKGVQRAGIGTIMPFQVPVLLLDSGANITVSPENLEMFAVIGSAYMKKMFGVEDPRVGLLNNGAEECKGTELQQAAYKILSAQTAVNFVGNIEGSVLPFDTCDVIVTDGFLGNILLKSSEGALKLMLKKMKAMFKGTSGVLAYLLLKSKLKAMKKTFDPAETGGAPILGISKPVIKAHGSSDARAFKNAIRQAVEYASSGALEEIAEAANAYTARKKAEREANETT
ncbi:MAG: phosphate acyltransferase PlsX [Clostridia bacterium]|nr:phosphate acyltransferase PlsX [Clostridia bacterium]